MRRRFDSQELHRLRGDSDEPPPLAGDDPLIGQLVSQRYRVVRKIDDGAQATIYMARHTLIKRVVALKVLTATTDNELVRRFLDEGQVAGTIGHPNIVESLDMGVTEDGRPFLVLEFLEGLTLARDLHQNGVFEVGRAAYIGMQIASALAAAHKRGIIHLDLKPENVFLVERNGRADHVKVIDFGVSKFASRALASDKPVLVFGTPEFMAPEQITNPELVDTRADVYALGAVLYEMLTGMSALGDVTELDDVLARAVQGTPTPLAELRLGLPEGLIATVERAMEKDREKRHRRIVEMKIELQKFAVIPVPLSRGGVAAAVADDAAARAAETESSPDATEGIVPSSRRPPSPAAPASTLSVAAIASPPAVATASDRDDGRKPRRPGPSRVVVAILFGACIVGALIWAFRVSRAPKRDPGSTSSGSSAQSPLERSTAQPPDSPAPPAPPPSSNHSVGSPRSLPSSEPSSPGHRATVPPPSPRRPPTADRTPEAPPPTGTIDSRTVQSIAQAHAAQTQSCFDQARLNNPDVRGRVVVHGNVDATGVVTSASVARTSANDTLLESCLVNGLRTWSFPPPAGGASAVVTYTFLFD